jgi:hypothetical protein
MSIEKNRLLMEQQIQKLKGQLNEAKIKKGSIVIAKKGIHKGDKHTVIHDFGDGTYNIMPVGYKNKYSLGAAGAKASELELVKEDQLNEDEYVQSMNIQKIANHLGQINKLWDEWKSGPLTKSSDIKPAQKQLKGWIDRWFKSNIK